MNHNDHMYDPINVFCKIALLSLFEQNTRIEMSGGLVTIQPADWGLKQALQRSWPLGARPSRNDMYRLLYPLKRILELVCSGVDVISYKAALAPPRRDSGSSDVRVGSAPASSSVPILRKETTKEGASAPSSYKSDDGVSLMCQTQVNRLYKNSFIKELVPYYVSGLRALQRTYGEGNYEATLQLAINLTEEAFSALDEGNDMAQVFRKFPPSFDNYHGTLIDKAQLIELWSTDASLEKIATAFRSYRSDALPQNLHRCRSEVSKILAEKDGAYLELVEKGSR